MSDVAEVTIAVPTINSSAWIKDLAEYYFSHGCNPVFLVDSRTSDNTIDKLVECGGRVVRLRIGPPYVEGMISRIKEFVSTPWVLRVDDDEVPSEALIAYLKRFAPNAEERIVSVVRRWLRFTGDNTLVYSSLRSWDWERSQHGEDRQFRLFDSGKVEYVDTIHTPGLHVDRVIAAPVECCLYHFDWILRSEARRIEKMRRYDLQTPGAGSSMLKFYHPEAITTWDHLEPVEDERISSLARRFTNVMS